MWKLAVTAGADATIFGAFGGYEKGAEVPGRYDWAAAQYVNIGASKEIEYLNTVAGAVHRHADPMLERRAPSQSAP
jgi:hypothetical protein